MYEELKGPRIARYLPSKHPSVCLIQCFKTSQSLKYGGRRMGGCQKKVVPFWVLSVMRHLVFRGPKRGP